ncbi:MAG: folylpolyglutamate synthase/dihydrofolate synthase family protein [Chloroflexota bacterium]
MDAYADALRWLLSFADWERGVGWSSRANPAEEWRLGRTRALLDLVGQPDRALSVILVAGTKGKGSTVAFMESLALAHGISVGAYTQPHLHTYRERVRLGGHPVEEPAFVRACTRLRAATGALERAHPDAGSPTTFELFTALAILAFVDAGVRLALVEVGLGGRLDATNALDPAVSVITPIGMDHTALLGRTLAKIAVEKAGILRCGRPAVSALQPRPAREALVRASARARSELRFVQPFRRPRDGSQASILGHVAGAPFRTELRLRGAHQRQNAALALAAFEVWCKSAAAAAPSAALTADALATTAIPARFEVLPAHPRVVIDAAHNPPSGRALARAIEEEGLPRPRWAVVGMYRDKDARGFLRPLADVLDGVVAVPAPGPRSRAAIELGAVARALGLVCLVEPDVAGGIQQATARAGAVGTVVVTGSFSLAAEARQHYALEGSKMEDPRV